MSMSKLKSITKVNYPVVGSVVVGIAAFGLVMYAIRNVPTNAATAPLKKAADVVTNG